MSVSDIVLPRFAQCQHFHCKYHRKEDRFNVKFFPKERLLVVECIECHPAMEIVRFRIALEDSGNEHLLLKPRSCKINSGGS